MTIQHDEDAVRDVPELGRLSWFTFRTSFDLEASRRRATASPQPEVPLDSPQRVASVQLTLRDSMQRALPGLTIDVTIARAVQDETVAWEGIVKLEDRRRCYEDLEQACEYAAALLPILVQEVVAGEMRPDRPDAKSSTVTRSRRDADTPASVTSLLSAGAGGLKEQAAWLAVAASAASLLLSTLGLLALGMLLLRTAG